MKNPLLQASGIPAFQNIRAEHVAPAVETVLAESRAALAKLEHTDPQKISLQELLETCDQINRRIHRAWSPVSHLLGTMNEPALRAAHEKCQPQMVAFGLEYSQNTVIYKAYKSIEKREKLNPAQKRLVASAIFDAEQSGIGLEGDKKKRFNEISQELSALSTSFSNHVLDATKAFGLELHAASDVDGLPAQAKALASAAYQQAHPDAQTSAERGPWRITLDGPSLMAFLQHAKHREHRRTLYFANLQKASVAPFDNAEILPKILALRSEKARLLGYENFAAMSLAKKMAGKVEKVKELSDQLLKASLAPAKKEFAELEAFAQSRGHQGKLAHWDTAFWTERRREAKYDLSDEETKPYFPLDEVLKGMFALVEDLFHIHVKAEKIAEVWHPDVRFFHIFDKVGQKIASFFLDPYARPATKRGGAWMDDCLGRDIVDGAVQLPIAHLVCNSSPPVGDVPSLMTFQEVLTLFHEFGHGLQHMLTTVPLPGVAGINGVEWDAVELPSQFMENWCYHRKTMMKLAKHYQTGQAMPESMFDKIYAAKNDMAASQMVRQLRFGMTDIALHEISRPMKIEEIFAIAARITEQTSVLPPLAEDKMLCSFSHIFAGGYAAGYYSYKWAEVLSADAFAAFEEAGLDDEAQLTKTGLRFRDTVLAAGGSQHPADVFRAFRGREPSIAALLKHYDLSPTSA